MSKVSVFLATGMEEVECLSVVDMLKRGGVEVEMISISEDVQVTGAHNITVVADTIFSNAYFGKTDMLFLPGGLPGVTYLGEHEGLCKLLTTWVQEGKKVAAICAAPTILGNLGLVHGKRVTCYPGCENALVDSIYTGEGIVTDGNITTGKSVGYAIDLGLELVRILEGEDKSAQVKTQICHPLNR